LGSPLTAGVGTPATGAPAEGAGGELRAVRVGPPLTRGLEVTRIGDSALMPSHGTADRGGCATRHPGGEVLRDRVLRSGVGGWHGA
jgi:hypothetical protein